MKSKIKTHLRFGFFFAGLLALGISAIGTRTSFCMSESNAANPSGFAASVFFRRHTVAGSQLARRAISVSGSLPISLSQYPQSTRQNFGPIIFCLRAYADCTAQPTISATSRSLWLRNKWSCFRQSTCRNGSPCPVLAIRLLQSHESAAVNVAQSA